MSATKPNGVANGVVLTGAQGDDAEVWRTSPAESPGAIGAHPRSWSAGSQAAEQATRFVVIDRDPGLLQVLSNRLDMHGIKLQAVSTAVTPRALAARRPNALVIDLAILGPGSWDYLERVCAGLPTLAVIICTGPSSVAQRVRGLRLGADAWVPKPCHAEELIAVIEAAIRRHRRTEVPDLQNAAMVGDVSIRPDLYQAYRGDISLDLTAREFEVLSLLSKSDRLLRREEIYEQVWGYEMASRGDRTVDVYIRKLRQKLRAASPQWSYIHTHYGVGYWFSANRVGEPDENDARTIELAAVADELDQTVH